MYDNTEMSFFVRLVASCAGSITCRYTWSNKRLAIQVSLHSVMTTKAMAEWLTRLTRNQMGSSRECSNPTRSGLILRLNSYRQFSRSWEKTLRVGFEPTREDPIRFQV